MGLLDIYHYFNTEVADVRTNSWMTISSPVPILVLTVMYLYFILVCGRKYMENRQAYTLKKMIKVFNIFQILSNAMLIYQIWTSGWYEANFFNCVIPDYSTNPRAIKITIIFWYLLVLKLIDYIETCMYVLRKKYRQVSFLHIYHHVSTVIINWITLKYFATGMPLMVPFVNCSIHVIMYTYYLLASFGPEIQRFLQPFKPLITILQMTQFIFLIAFSMQTFISNCPGMKIPAVIIIANLIINFYLFYDFYRKNYLLKNSKKT